MVEEKKVLLSGVKPSGRPHIGNYFGALRQFVDLQDQYQSYIMLADYHALISMDQPDELRQSTTDLAIDYLAIGLDPSKTIIFKQSDVPEHTELAWIFNCLTTMPYLARAHAYKDAVAKEREVSVGLFDYPLLMAADILLYEPAVVPVGQDQKQHVEIARDTAEKFNRLYGQTFVLPEPLIQDQVKTIVGLDGRKMSKSYNNTIPLFATDDEWRQLVMSIKTDSRGVDEPKDPETCGVFALHRLFSESQLMDLEQRYRAGGIGYAESKQILADNVIKTLSPLRARRAEVAARLEGVKKILVDGAAAARAQAARMMGRVRSRIGVA